MYRLILLLSILLVLLLVGLTAYNLYWRHQVKMMSADTGAVVINAAALTSGMLKVRQWERLVEAEPPRAGRQYNVEFNAAELQAIVREAEVKNSTSTLVPASLKVSIVEQKIVVSGIMRQPFYLPLTVVATTGVKDGFLLSEIISAHFGFLPVSTARVDKLAKEIFGADWQAEINRPSFVWDDLVISDDKLYVTGHTTGEFYK